MEHEFTITILRLSAELDAVINDVNFFVDECSTRDLWISLEDKLPALIDCLQHEYHQNHKIDPLIIHLREKLEAIMNESCDFPIMPGGEFELVLENCLIWLDWISKYYPQEPGEMAQEPAAPRPRTQTKTIKDYILLQDNEQKDRLIKVLHSLLDNKKGRWAGLVIAISVRLGLLAKPTFKMLVAEFGDIGNESGFNKYYDIADKALKGEINTYRKEEISIIKDKFSCFVTQDNSAK